MLLLSATSPSTRWTRAAFGIAAAEAVRSCFIQRPTPTPARTAQTTATSVKCGHTFRLFIGPSKLFGAYFGNHHAQVGRFFDCNRGETNMKEKTGFSADDMVYGLNQIVSSYSWECPGL